MFRSRKKKTSFEPGPEEFEQYPEQQQDHRPHHSHHEQMSRSSPQQILNNLASSSNELAAGIAICVKALAEATASPPASPVVVEYRNRRMIFGRRNLARMDGYEAVRHAVRTIYPQGTATEAQRFVVEASLFTEDGRADRRIASVDLDSWGEILPHIHSLYLRLDVPPTSPRDGDPNRDRDRYRDRDRDRDRDRYRDPRDRERDRDRPRRESTSGAEKRDDRVPADEPPPAAVERNQSQNDGFPPE